MQALVIGCGVSGLSCAVTLLGAGIPVQVWGRELASESTSAVAAAFWYPYRASPPDRVTRWAQVSYREFERLAADPATGVRMLEALELLAQRCEPPEFLACTGMRPANSGDLPPGFAAGYRFRAPVIDMRSYLPYLVERVHASGGEIHRRELGALAEVTRQFALVINCAGLGARELVPDREMLAIRGQVLRVKNPGLDRVVVDDTGPEPTYIVPRGDEVVLGGTAEESEESTAIDPEQSKAILQRCCSLEPRLRLAEPIAAKAGLRPGRTVVRLELQRLPTGIVIHNYGHGGAGVTLSWGCAAEVLKLLREAKP